MTAYATTDQMAIRMQSLKVPSAAELIMFEDLLDSASRTIDRACRRADDGFIADTAETARYFTGFGETYLRIADCMEISEVAVKESVTSDDYDAWATPTSPMAGDGDWIPCAGNPEDPTFGRMPYNLLIIDLNGEFSYFIDGDGIPTVKVTAKWGPLESVPSDIREAVCMQAIIWYKTYQGAMSRSLGTVDFGQITTRRGLDKSVRDILVEGMWILPLYGEDL